MCGTHSEINDVNAISGTIPSELESLAQLTKLYVPRAGASGFRKLGFGEHLLSEWVDCS